MNYYDCPYGDGKYSSSGIRGHLRFKHGLSEEEIQEKISALPIISNISPQSQARPSVSVASSPTVDVLAEKLRIAQLQMQIDALGKPQPQFDATQKLLDMQEKHFSEMSKVREEIVDLKLEMIKAQSGSSDDEGGILKALLPYLPQILAKKTADIPANGNGLSPSSPTPEAQTQVMEKKEKIPEWYIQDIKAGKITEAKAWKDLKNAVKLKLAKKEDIPTREEFHKEFEKIKNEA